MDGGREKEGEREGAIVPTMAPRTTPSGFGGHRGGEAAVGAVVPRGDHALADEVLRDLEGRTQGHGHGLLAVRGRVAQPPCRVQGSGFRV